MTPDVWQVKMFVLVNFSFVTEDLNSFESDTYEHILQGAWMHFLVPISFLFWFLIGWGSFVWHKTFLRFDGWW